MSLARRRLVRVPASSANLGPGFDVLAVALSLHLEVEVTETGRFEVHTELPLPGDRQNLVVQAFERLHPAEGMQFRISSRIPLSGGLGSSAAAVIAGLMAADHMFELDADIAALATQIEGHPDNVGAALRGGFVICDGARIDRLEPPLGLEAVLVVPHGGVGTERARRALPSAVALADVSFNLAAVARLMLGLAGPDWELIADGLQDRLHQDQRAHLYPRSAQVVRDARSFGALGATISGAGPTVMVWCRFEHTGMVIEALRHQAEEWAQVMRAPFESQGADVREL